MSEPSAGNSPLTTSSGGSNSNVAEMSDKQFKASLEALVADESWNGGFIAQATTEAPPTTVDVVGSSAANDGNNKQTSAVRTDSATMLMKTAPISALPAFDPTMRAAGLASGTAPSGTPISIPAVAASTPSMPVFAASGATGLGGASIGATTRASQLAQHVSFAPMVFPAMTTRSVAGKRALSTAAVSEDEGERERRRQDRNLREQQRSQQITHQIGHLRDMLTAANLEFKNDKYSTLVAVGEYLKSLQSKSSTLEKEHRKLLETISQTSDAVNKPYVATDAPSVGSSKSGAAASPPEEDATVFVSGLDYKAVFQVCPVACALVSIDGRFLSCNKEFEDLSGFPKNELLPSKRAKEEENNDTVSREGKADRNMSLFNILKRSDMENVFVSMSKMLKLPYPEAQKDLPSEESERQSDRWSGKVSLTRHEDSEVCLDLHLIRCHQGRPKFFNCILREGA